MIIIINNNIYLQYFIIKYFINYIILFIYKIFKNIELIIIFIK